MPSLKEDRLISPPSTCSSNSWRVVGSPGIPHLLLVLLRILAFNWIHLLLHLFSFNIAFCIVLLCCALFMVPHVSVQQLHCIASDGCCHYVTSRYHKYTAHNCTNLCVFQHILHCPALQLHCLHCLALLWLACDGCRHYVTGVRHFLTDGWTPRRRQISQKRFHKSEICHILQICI